MEKTCAQCGASYNTPNSRRRFCSRSCFYESMRKADARYHPQQRECKVCGTEFEFKWNGRKYHRGLYCSRACSSIGRKGQVPDQLGEKHWNWKGGRVEWPGGYIAVRINGKYVLEHRHVMAEHLGRPLLPTETVHHVDGDKMNNAVDNLEVWSSRHPKGQRVDDLVAFAREILDLYGKD